MMNDQKRENYIQSLAEKHREIENEIEQAYKGYAPDHVIEDLKKRKLKIRDTIVAETQKINTDS